MQHWRRRLGGGRAVGTLALVAAALTATSVLRLPQPPQPLQVSSAEGAGDAEKAQAGCHAEPGHSRAFNRAYEADERERCGFRLRASWRPLVAGDSAPVWRDYAEMHARCRDVGNAEGCKALVWHCSERDVCGGHGDQVKGLASALYIAVLTSRVLFVQWERFGTDLISLFEAAAIDVRPTDAWKCSREVSRHSAEAPHTSFMEWFWTDDPPVDAKVAEFLARQEPCLVLQSGLGPEDLSWARGTDMGDTFGCVVDPAYARGCALRYLFRPGFRWLQTRDAGRPHRCGGRLPLPHVGVHLRLGDDFLRPGWEAHNLSLDHEQLVHGALACAKALGTEVFGQSAADDPSWQVVLAADSVRAKLLARKEADRMGISLRMPSGRPRHSDLGGEDGGGRMTAQDADADALAEYVRDVSLLVDSGAFVRAPSHSGFAESAVQHGLIPPRRVRDERCEPAAVACAPKCQPPERRPPARGGELCAGAESPLASCRYSVGISRSDHDAALRSATTVVHGPPGLSFRFDGCSTAGKEGRHCTETWSVAAGVRLLKSSLGDVVGYGQCCNDVRNHVVGVTMTCR